MLTKIKIGYAPTRRAIFSAPAAIEYRGRIVKRLTELGVDFVDIDDVNDEGLLYDDAGPRHWARRYSCGAHATNVPTRTACVCVIVSVACSPQARCCVASRYRSPI